MQARRLLAAARITSLDPDAQILIDAMSVKPPMDRAVVISDHIVVKKDIGSWQLSDTYYMMAAHHEQASRLNWKNPGSFTLTANGGITFTIDRGWQGNGSTGYLNTGWIPSSHGVNYVLNDASFGTYSRTNVFGGGAVRDCGVSDGTRSMDLVSSGTNYFGRANNVIANSVSFAATNSLGFHVVRRPSSSSLRILKNGAEVGIATVSSNGLPTRSLPIGVFDNNGSFASYSTRQYSAAFTAAAMTPTQQADLHAALQTGYLASVGAAV